MTTKSYKITVSGQVVEIIRKAIKNLHLGVYPPDGRVRVAAPPLVSDEAIRLAVIRKIGWIRKQRARFAAQERQSQREMISGESHFYLGKQYRLNLVERDSPVGVTTNRRGMMELRVRPGYDRSQREQVLLKWYRSQLRSIIPPLLEKWQRKLGVTASAWGIKKMKTKWGSCNATSGRIWLNLELAKKPIQCLEYIIVHELVHLLEPHHNERFTELMDRFMPKWRLHRAELNRTPLAHEDWKY